jgi:hypothetical protein
MRYWQIKGDPEERHFCFTTEPRMECPFESVTYAVTDLASGETTTTKRRPQEHEAVTSERHVSPEMEQAAQLLGMRPKALDALVTNGHRHGGGRWRDPATGKLTNRCKACGSKLIDHGYSAYVERPKREDEFGEMDQTNAALASRLGMQPPMLRLKGANGLKRSEARKWAWEARQQVAAELEEMSGAPSRSGHSKGRA